MEQLRAILAKLRHFFEGSLAERDFDEEARTHMALRADRFTRRGMTPEAAWREARRQFGNATSLKEARHDMQTFAWLERLWHEDIRIRKGDRVVELRPMSAKSAPESPRHLSPREALRCLQRDAGLAPERAESYLREVHEERLTAEDHRGQ